jgi:hypothetical protein
MNCSSRQPVLDAARILIFRGVAAATQIEVRHAGAEDVALLTTVETASKLRILEGERDTIRFARWSAFKNANLPTRRRQDSANDGDEGHKAQNILDDAA